MAPRVRPLTRYFDTKVVRTTAGMMPMSDMDATFQNSSPFVVRAPAMVIGMVIALLNPRTRMNMNSFQEKIKDST